MPLELQRPLPDEALRIVAKGERADDPARQLEFRVKSALTVPAGMFAGNNLRGR
jgi:hypothetical protein